MTNQLKNFIERNIELIEDKNFEDLYINAYMEYRNERNGVKPTDISALTDILANIFGEEPIFTPNLTYVPIYYRIGDGKIKHLEIPESIDWIGSSAFRNCINLEYLKLPKTLSEIGDEAFKGCNRLNKIFYDGTIGDWNSIKLGMQAFGSNGWIQYDKVIYCNDGEVVI